MRLRYVTSFFSWKYQTVPRYFLTAYANKTRVSDPESEQLTTKLRRFSQQLNPLKLLQELLRTVSQDQFLLTELPQGLDDYLANVSAL